MTLRSLSATLLVLPLLTLVAACDDDGGGSTDLTPTGLEIAGFYASAFGGTESISDAAWADAAVREYDNAANVAYVQNPSDAAWNADKFSKIVWTDPAADGAFYYCFVTFGLDTLDAAKADATEADASDPATGGCGGFSWTQLTPTVELQGLWANPYGFTEDITASTWTGGTLHRYDNDENWAVVQNPANAEYNADKFAKIVWTEPVDGAFWYCTVVYGLDTLDDALSTAETADASDPATGGCGGFSWTLATPAIELHGTWVNDDGDTLDITSFTAGLDAVVEYDNAANWAVLEIPGATEADAETYDKVVWTEPYGEFYYCRVDTGLADAATAEASTATADSADYETGCGGQPWAHLTAQ